MTQTPNLTLTLTLTLALAPVPTLSPTLTLPLTLTRLQKRQRPADRRVPDNAADVLCAAGRALAAACGGAVPLREEAMEQGRRIAYFIRTKDTVALRSAPRTAPSPQPQP